MINASSFFIAEGRRDRMKRYFNVWIGILLILTFTCSFAVYATAAEKTSIANLAPTSSFTFSPLAPMPGDIITFDASASHDSDGYIIGYRWDFGDGNVITTVNPTATHSYPVDGAYTVELTVTDDGLLTGSSSAIVQVNCLVFFRAVFMGTLIPIANVQVTAYRYNGTAWAAAPVGSNALEIKYDNMTQPNLASTSQQKYRNPGYTASILRENASNIGFDIHQSNWDVYFKFQWGPYTAYWPNETTRVYSYNNGAVETHDYGTGHKAYWDATAGTYVIKTSHIQMDGVNPIANHPIMVGILCPPTQQYYLTTRTDPLGITTIPGAGWYNKDTNATLTAPVQVAVSGTTQYRFSYWDVDGTSRGAGVNPITVQMNVNHTATAHYVLQYSVTFWQAGMSPDATGTVVTVDGTPKTLSDLPYTKWVDTSGTVTYSYSSIVTSSTSGKRYRLTSVTGSTSPITVAGPVNVTGNFVTQYLVTFAQTGLDSTATGTVVTVNGTAKTYTDLPYNWWVDSGSTITYTYHSIVSSSVADKQFRLTGVNCPPSQFIVTEPVTITGSYCCQYKVAFKQTGLDSTASGTVVTVNGTTKTYTGLPYSIWVDSGTSIVYTYTSVVTSSYSTKQFRLASVTGPSSPFTVTSPTTVTGNYVVQYLVTFGQSGLDSTATGTVVTVNGNAKTYGNLPYSLWVDSGGSVTFSYVSPVSSSVSGKQFRLTGVTGSTSPFTVSGAATVTGNYVVQYLVTFGQSGLDSTATGTVVTVNGNAKTYGNLPYSLWVDSGGSVTFSYVSPVSSSVSGKQFRLTGVTGSTSPITVTGAATVTGNYVVQHQITFTYTGLDSTATGAVVTVDGNTKEYVDLPYAKWVDTGSTVTYSYNDVVLSTASGKRFKLTGITGPASPVTVTSSVTATGNYKTQYEVGFDQSGVGSDFAGTVLSIDSTNYNAAGLPVSFWWDQSSSHSFSFTSPLTVNASKQYSWTSTSGLSSLQSGTLTISTSGSVVGSYIVQNSVTFDQTGVGSDFTGTVATVDGTPYALSTLPKSFYWQLGTIHNFTFQSPLIVTANGKQYVWTSTSGLSNAQSTSITVTTFGSIVGNFKTQYYLNLATSPPDVTTPFGSGWYDSGTFANISTDQYKYGGSRYWFIGWTTSDMSEITDPSSTSTTVLIDKTKTVYANYAHQYLVTFLQSGLASDANGNVVTVNGSGKAYGDLPYSVWVDQGSILSYSYENPVTCTTTGKQFALTGVTGLSSPITVNADINNTGNYKTQYILTVSSPFGTCGGQGWYDNGATSYATLNVGIVDLGNATRKVFTSWNGDASGANYAQSNPITMSGPKTAVANWKTQYAITFTHSGLDNSASGTVVTANGTPVSYPQLPYAIWADVSSSVTYSYGNVSSSTPNKRFAITGVSGPSSPITITGPLTVTGNYLTQYQVTFSQTGVGSEFTGTILTIDGNTYTFTTLSTSFWWDNGSSHTFSYLSPLVVNASRQYTWVSTTGLSTLQNGTINISSPGSVIGNYAAENSYQVTFNQTGLSPDFTGTVLTVDSSNYIVTDLPLSFWWDSGSSHTFSYLSPLIVTANTKQYVWTSTSGLSSAQTGTLTVAGSGSATGNYKTQYYLTLATSPLGIASPSGAGWYDAGANATVSTQAFVDITPGLSRYRFNGWTTPDMSEIGNPLASPTTVLVDKAKTVTAEYVVQYKTSFNQSGVNSDFTGTVTTIDGISYSVSTLPASFWYDDATTHTFAFQSPLLATPNAKQYVWTATTGLSTLQTGTITVSSSGTVTGNYKTQYYLTVTSAYGTPSPTSGWFDSGSSITASTSSPVSGPTGTRYVCTGWTGTGNVPSSGSSTSVAFTITQPSTLVWNWKTQYYLTVKTDPVGLVTIIGEGWYDTAASVTLTAPSVTTYNFVNWDVDGTSKGNGVNPITQTMNAPHTATAHYQQTSVDPLTASITPLSTMIHTGQSVTFSSTVTGGSVPYSYQWYINDHPFPNATIWNWTFTPSSSGVYYVYLRITDTGNTTAQSQTARVDVISTPVGGISISHEKPLPIASIATYIALVGLFGAVLSFTKRKRK
jgi:hypothetical protein